MSEPTPSAETQALLQKIAGDRGIVDIVADAEAHAREAIAHAQADSLILARASGVLSRLANVAKQCEEELMTLKGFGAISEHSRQLYQSAKSLADELARIAEEMDPEPDCTDGEESGPDDPEYPSTHAERRAPRDDDEVYLAQ